VKALANTGAIAPDALQRAKPVPSKQLGKRALALFFAAGLVSIAIWLSLHHPLSGAAAVLGCVGVAVLACWAGVWWPLVMLPWFPAAGLATWTGWMTVEETDLLILACAAGCYARLAFMTPLERPGLRGGLGGWILVLAYGALMVVSAQRGIADAGGLHWGWWQSYHEPMNVLRLLKAPVLALLLLPLIRAWWQRHAQAHSQAWILGMALQLAAVGALTVWERTSFIGLTNFSSDYRATALFWEMHVGGAALDAALALTMPFALAALLRARTTWAWGAWALTLALGFYASLATFSRIVYLAVPLGCVTLLILQALQRRAPDKTAALAGPVGTGANWTSSVLLSVLFGLLGFWIFAEGGYRGLLALLGAVVLLLPVAGAARRLPGLAFWSLGFGGGVVLVGISVAVSLALSKGAYLAYGACALLGAGAAWASWRAQAGEPSAGPWKNQLSNSDAVLLASFLAAAAGVALVTQRWAETRSSTTPLLVAMVLAAAPVLLRLLPVAPWPEAPRWQASRAVLLGAVGLGVAVFGGGAYMGERFSSSDRDLDYRLGHWSRALSMLSTGPDNLLGRGVGRYAASLALSGRPEDQTGGHRLLNDEQGSRLLLTSGKHVLGPGQLYRFSQRIASPPAGLTAKLRIRADKPVDVQVDICEKNLLYAVSCVEGKKSLGLAGPGQWQVLEIPLAGRRQPSSGPWYAPRLVVFSVSLDAPGVRAEIAQIQVGAGAGPNLLANSDFSRGLAQWYFSSDHHHMPWHAKNVLIHLWFEQGVIGMLVFSLLVLVSFWILIGGALRHDPLAPPIAAALLGFLVVGFADSLFDMPRIGFMAYLLVGLALTLPNKPVSRSSRRSRKRKPSSRSADSPAPLRPA
jgi:hypothetical protein